MIEFLLVVMAVLALIFWFVPLLDLMKMTDESFPGRFDKPIWAAILILLPVLGSLLFVIWKWSRHADQESSAIAGQLEDVIRRSGADSEAP